MKIGLLVIALMCFSISLMAQEVVKGKVTQVIPVDNYTYLEIKTSKGLEWAAVSKDDVKVGASVTVEGASPMHNFESKSLKRTFKKIYFGALGTGTPAKGEKPVQKHAVAPESVKVEKAKASDAKSVEELYTQKKELNGKSVTVAGKVIKFSPGIMGKNWVHLQDGTGKPDTKNFDITVTTQDNFKVGDTVTIKGTVAADKDFGSGYFFPVIIEEAKKL